MRYRNCSSHKMGHPLLDLTDKTAVVIGGTSGIGLTLARGLAMAGANVIARPGAAQHWSVRRAMKLWRSDENRSRSPAT